MKIREWLWWHITLPWMALRMQLGSRHDIEGEQEHEL